MSRAQYSSRDVANEFFFEENKLSILYLRKRSVCQALGSKNSLSTINLEISSGDIGSNENAEYQLNVISLS